MFWVATIRLELGNMDRAPLRDPEFPNVQLLDSRDITQVPNALADQEGISNKNYKQAKF